MSTGSSNSTHRSWYYWLTLVPLIAGASWTFLIGAASDAFYFGHYGKASQALRAQAAEARRMGELCEWVTMGLALIAIIVAAILIRPFKSETLPVGLRVVVRVGLAVVLVAGSILLVAYGLSAVGH